MSYLLAHHSVVVEPFVFEFWETVVSNQSSCSSFSHLAKFLTSEANAKILPSGNVA